MKGTNFGNGVLVTKVDLDRVGESSADEIQQSRVDTSSGGVLTGGEVTVNLTNTDRVDVAAFTGYTPRGDYIVGDVSTSNVPMSSSVNGTNNYVIGMYSETLVGTKPHESNGTVLPTRKEASFSIVVYTEADYNDPSVLALSDSNLSNPAKDRSLVLSIVTATGGALSSSSIESPTVFNDMLYSNPITIPSMLGVDITYIDPTTTTGSGTLEYQYVAPNYQLRWTAPENSAGSWVSWTVDDTQNVTDGSGNYITASMSISQMDTSGTFPYSEVIQIVDEYNQDIPRNTAEDHYHRSKRGTGIVSETNPHGIGLNDIAEDSITLLDEHQDVHHCNGIYKGSLSSTLGTYVISSAGFDTLGINPPSSGSLYYVNGTKQSSLDTTSISFSSAGTVSSMWENYVTDNATVHISKKFQYPSSRNVRGTWIINSSDSYIAGNYDLELVVSLIGAVTLFTFTWDGGAPVAIVEGSSDQAIRLYSSGGLSFIDLWVRSSASGSSDGYLPSSVATYTDSVTVYDSVSWDTNIHIANVPYWYDSISIQGKIGYAPYDGSRVTVDKRPWGTMCAQNISDDFLQEYIYHANDEYQVSGVLLYRDAYFSSSSLYGANFLLTSSSSSLNVDIAGGNLYCRGKRLSASGTTLTFSANKEYLAYVDDSGVIQFLNVTDDYSGSRATALEYLLGNSSYRDNISSVYHATKTDYRASPERGVPLHFIVTDSTGVDSSLSVLRNVNEVSDPWSVGSIYGAAFTTIESAVLYASVYPSRAIDITIVGTTVVTESFTQPSNVHILGISDNVSLSVTATATSSTGVWKLSSNSKVSNLCISATGVESLFGLNTDVEIRNCTLSVLTGVILFGDNSVTSIDNVVLDGNTFEIQSMSDPSDFGSSTFENWIISNNYIESESSGFASWDNGGLVNLPLDKSSIINNTFIVKNGSAGFQGGALTLIGAENVLISGNTISIGEGDNAVAEVGIKIEHCTNLRILGNQFLKDSTNTNKASIGLLITDDSGDSSGIIVSNNVFKGINVGINSSSAGVGIDNFIVSNNNFSSLFSSAVSLSVDSTNVFEIRDNTIFGISYDVDSLSGMKDVIGIEVVLMDATLMGNITITGNTIRSLVSSSTTGSISAISLEVQDTVYRVGDIDVSDNRIMGMSYSGLYTTSPTSGVDVSVSSSVVNTVNIDRNKFFAIVTDYHMQMISYYQNISSTEGSVNISGNSVSTCTLKDTASITKSSRVIKVLGQGGASSGNQQIKINDNMIEIFTNSLYNASTSLYAPIAVLVDGFSLYSVIGNSIRYQASSGVTSSYDGYGIVVDKVGDGLISNNTITTPRSSSIKVDSTTTSGRTSIISNIIFSDTSGIYVSDDVGFTTVELNEVALIPREDYPAAGNLSIFDGASMISVSSAGGFQINNNKTYTTSEVTHIGSLAPSSTNLAHHHYLEINDNSDSTNSYKVENNLVDLESQGINGGTYSMAGIRFQEGSSYNGAVGHLISFQANSLIGGKADPSGSITIPMVDYSGGGYQPFVVFFGALSETGSYFSQYIVGSNTSYQSSNGVSNIVVETDTTNFNSPSTNWDAGVTSNFW